MNRHNFPGVKNDRRDRALNRFTFLELNKFNDPKDYNEYMVRKTHEKETLVAKVTPIDVARRIRSKKVRVNRAR